MFAISLIPMKNGMKKKILFDLQTTMPLFYPLRYSIDYLNNRSISTQDASLQAIKYFYEYWLAKYQVTFCYSFYKSNHNPSIAMDELDNFFRYLENQNSYTPNIINFNSNPNSTIYTHAERVRAVARFIKYLIGKYVTAYYDNSEPKELIRYADRLQGLLSIKTREFNSLYTRKKPSKNDFDPGFKSLTMEMVSAVYRIIAPSSSKKNNELNPFSTMPLQFRNYLIVRILLNYGLRVGELMLLELDSIKVNMRGDRYSLIIANISEDHDDPRSRLPSIKTAKAHRVVEIEISDYNFLHLYIKRIRPQVKHKFIFTTLKKPFNPLSYHAIYLLFSNIDNALAKNYPIFKNSGFWDSVGKLTPHTARHTWAYLTLKNIYISKYTEVMKIELSSYIDFSNKGIMEDSKSQLRELAGWSFDSHMPAHYAKRFTSEQANKFNLKRIQMEQSAFEFDEYLEDF